MIVFDIETGPLDEATILANTPAFDKADVKLGNLADPEKIARKLEDAEREHRLEAIGKASLSPLTGCVVAIGYMGVGEAPDPPRIAGAFREGRGGLTELEMLDEFWRVYSWAREGKKALVGFNSHSFDVPFLVRRSWIVGSLVPPNLTYRNRYFNPPLLDLREMWSCGEFQAKGSLDSICRACGLGQKNGEGKDFVRLWNEDPPRAIEYLQNDLQMTSKLALRMGVG